MSQPNLLIIHTDQQSSWTLSAYGGTLIETPNIDRIGREGAIFTSFFTNSAICTPSRGCFVTGRYPHSHGAYTNNIPLNRDEITFARALLDAGYDTGYAGKWHLDGTPRPGWVHPERAMGFADARFMFNRGHFQKIEDSPMKDMQPVVHPYGVIGDEKTYTTDWLTDKTIDFLSRPRANPFCYMVSIPDPHDPCEVRAPYDTLLCAEDMPLPPTFSQEALPAWADATRARGRYPLDDAQRAEKLRRRKALYFGEAKLIDDSVGRIIDCLEGRGILDDTIVVFTTDHGDYMGEHGLSEKNHLYETAYRIPLLVRWPEKIAPGTRADRIFSTVDFQPTILSLMGVGPCGREQGRDGSALLTGRPIEWVDEAFIHHSSLERAGIFTPEFELAYVKDDEAILFDRLNDGDQVHNLYGDGDHLETVRRLRGRIVQHHRDVNSPATEWLEQIGC